MSAFRREGVLSYIATTITLFPIPVFTVILGLASVNGIFEEDTMHMIFVGVEFTLGVLLPILIMLVLFLPNVSMLACATYICKISSVLNR